jgi:hypothetical protein
MKRTTILFSMLLLFAGLVTAQDKNLPKFSGLMFGDYFYNASQYTAANKDLNGFQFRRIYITTDYAIDENFTSRFRLEADQSTNSQTLNGKIGVMVKDAWLKWGNIFSGSDLIFGLSPTPAFDVSEGAWGHRYLEKTIMDLNGVVSSRDLGVDLKGKLDDGGTVKYWVKIGNNSSNGVEADKYKRFYGLLEFDPSANLLITVYGDYASYAKILDKYTTTYKNNSAFVGSLFLNYKEKGSFSVGAEGFIKSQQNNYSANTSTTSLESQSGNGISLWAYVNLSEKVQLVGRFDTYDPNTDKSKDGKSLILGGIQFNPAKNVNVTPNIEVVTYQADATGGGDKSDVVPRISFFWQF